MNTEIVERQVKALPVLLSDCTIPPFLTGKIYADFRGDYKKGLSSLVGALIPKGKFDTLLSHSAVIGGETALTSFKDDWDQPMLRRQFPFVATVADIRKTNPPKNEGLWVEIHFDGVAHLEPVELFTYKKQRNIRLSYHTDLAELVPKRKDERKWQDIVEATQQEIWKHDSTILELFDSTELAVNWGGPDGQHVSADTEVMYYIDHNFGYLMADRTFRGRTALDLYTLEDLHLSAVTLSAVVDNIIEGVRTTVRERAAFRRRRKKG